jgi:hypothetical protein
MVLPVPTGVPLPQASAYQIQLALLPKRPPLTRRLTGPPPGQIESSDALMLSGLLLLVFTLMVLLTQRVVLQTPSARTK